MTARDRNDNFLVGDTHQRVYNNQVALGSLGVHIRGRSARLTLSYRTTRRILGSALGPLSGESFDDLDGNQETPAGRRPVLSGTRPQPHPAEDHSAEDWEAERRAVAELVASWDDIPAEQIAVCVPTNDMAREVGEALWQAGVRAVEIGPDRPRGDEGAHIGTMFRFKALEYQRMVISGVNEGLVPRTSVIRLRDTDALRHRRELRRARSLLFVAATRSRDALAISWHGAPSRFPEPLLDG